MNLDDIKIYLPKYLSESSEKELFQGLKEFPDNIDSRIYTSALEDSDVIYQGDGICDLPYLELPSTEIRKTNCMVFSNTCDIDLRNAQKFSTKITYSPIVNLQKYKNALLQSAESSAESIESHLDAIRKQQKTQVFYLPAIKGVIEESIIFLDRIISLPNKEVSRDNIKVSRIFTLSNYGAYLFLFKLSIHFTRIQDKVDRAIIS